MTDKLTIKTVAQRVGVSAKTIRPRREHTMTSRDQILEALACEIDSRPRDAPGVDDVARSVRRVHREAGAIVVAFDPAAAATVAEFVAAEQRCCATLGWAWDAARAPASGGSVSGTPAQLELIEQLFTRGQAG